MKPGSSRRYQIRSATEADLPGVLRCLRLAFEPYRDQYTPEAFLDTVLTTETARDRLGSMRVLVAEQRSGEAIGTLAWRPESEGTGHLRGMAVVPDHQGTGAAQALLDVALREMTDRGFTRLTLHTTPPLHRAIRFYERNGFRPSGRVSDFFGMPLTEWVRDLRAERSRNARTGGTD